MAETNDSYKRAKAALDAGENFLAYDLAERISPEADGDTTKKLHIQILALARSGSLRRAQELFRLLPAESDDPEIEGLRSRLSKDMAIASRDPEVRHRHFFDAARTSEAVFNRRNSWYNGINAASCFFLAGEREKARNLVRTKVLPLCRAEPDKDMWLDATLGECHLLLGDYEAAATAYSSAARTAVASGQYGSFSSTLRQLSLLTDAIGDPAKAVWDALKLPAVAVFSGHIIDRPDRPTPRFPISAEPQVRREIAAAIRAHDIRIGYCSCAAGGDILFIEELLAAGGECRVVPPFPLETTIRNSVSGVPGDWERRLRTALANQKCHLLDPECDETGEGDDIVYDFTNRYLLGLAIRASRNLHLPLRGLAVWNGIDSGLPGGTDSAVRLWRERQIPVDIIKPEVAQ